MSLQISVGLYALSLLSWCSLTRTQGKRREDTKKYDKKRIARKKQEDNGKDYRGRQKDKSKTSRETGCSEIWCPSTLNGGYCSKWLKLSLALRPRQGKATTRPGFLPRNIINTSTRPIQSQNPVLHNHKPTPPVSTQ
jgi:hypothetical protein